MSHEKGEGTPGHVAAARMRRHSPGGTAARVAGVTSIVLVSLLHPFFIASVVAVAALAVRPRRRVREGPQEGPQAQSGGSGGGLE